MDLNKIVRKEPLAETSDNEVVEIPDNPAVLQEQDVIEDASANKNSYNDSWIGAATEPDEGGSVTINLNIKYFEAPEKKPGEWRDTDRDGLTDAQEAALGTDPLQDADFDNDGVPDAVEVSLGMNPKDADTDHDGIADGIEYNRSHLAALIPAADPSKASDTDWDGDGFSNDIEVTYGMNPSIPESKIPGNEKRMAQQYNFRKTGEPLHDAILSSDLQRKLSAEEEGKVLDAVFDGMTSNDLLGRYHTAAALNVLDGTPIDPNLQAEMDQYNKDLTNALVNRDLKSWISVQNARGLPVNQQTIDSFLNPTASQLFSDVRTSILVLGVNDPTDGTALGASFTKLGLNPDGSPVDNGTADASSGSGVTTNESLRTNSNLAEDFLDRTSSLGPSVDDSPSEASGTDTPSNTLEVESPAGSDSIDTFLANLQAPSTEAPEIPSSRGGSDSVAAPESPSMNSFEQSDSSAGSSGRTPIVTGGEEEMTVSNIVDVQTTTRPDGTVDHTTVTYTDGSKDILDANDNVIFHIEPPPPEADASDGTNPNEGTTDDDGASNEPEDEGQTPVLVDSGNSGEATAYVNPDADVTYTPMAPSAVVGQIITTGVDPTTTTPSNPYVDDAVGPLKVSSTAVNAGLNVPLKPGVTDGNPDLEVISGGTGGLSRGGFNPDGPDTVNPNDPEVGSSGEDINPGDFTPRPGNA